MSNYMLIDYHEYEQDCYRGSLFLKEMLMNHTRKTHTFWNVQSLSWAVQRLNTMPYTTSTSTMRNSSRDSSIFPAVSDRPVPSIIGENKGICQNGKSRKNKKILEFSHTNDKTQWEVFVRKYLHLKFTRFYFCRKMNCVWFLQNVLLWVSFFFNIDQRYLSGLCWR